VSGTVNPMRGANIAGALRLLTIAAMITTAGCGGDDTVDEPRQGVATSVAPSATPPPTPRPAGLTHARLAERLNAICRSANRRVNKIRESGPVTTETVRQALSVYNDVFDALARLRPRAADREAFARYVRAQRRSRALVRRLGDAVATRDDGAMVPITEALDRQGRARLAAALDLDADDCGR